MTHSYHSGEVAIQEQAGERPAALQNEGMIADSVGGGSRAFLAKQRVLAIASSGSKGDMWASLLFGQPGFVASADGQEVRIDCSKLLQQTKDPLWSNLFVGAAVGLVAIDLEARRRLRINGVIAKLTPGFIDLTVVESYSNCPKHIQRRRLRDVATSAPETPAAMGELLDPARRKLLKRADTLFVASRHPERGADVSHRGGPVGFIRILDEHTLRLPDYPGNGLFNTLGNFEVNDAAGLVVPDFERGRLLQLTGRVTLRLDGPEAPTQPSGGTGRYWNFHVSQWRESDLPKSLRWDLLEASPFNPA